LVAILHIIDQPITFVKGGESKPVPSEPFTLLPVTLDFAAGLAFRQAGPATGAPVLLVHGYPESSYMWRHALPALGAAGWRALAPDLAGYGDSDADPPGTWERHTEGIDRFVRELSLEPVVLVTHDWGVPIGLKWACDNPGVARALVISDGGFFADRRWHDLANVMRTPGEGERLIASYTRDGLAQGLKAVSEAMTDDAVDEYWKGFAGDARRQGHLELYRSGDFEKLEPYGGRLGEMALPTLILWGGRDRFASVRMAHRFRDEIPGSEHVVFDEAGHFVWEDEPQRTTAALVDFLARRVR
jgi:haloalkane dehalogenase